MTMRFRSVAILAVAVTMQEPAAVRLGSPTGELAETFTSASSIRELRDGRVLLTDPREKRIVVAEFGSGQAQTVARAGSGPGEYEYASPIYALNGDSSIMVDMASRRWLILLRDRVVATLPAYAPGPAAIGDKFVLGTDGRDAVLTGTRPLIPKPTTTPTAADSTSVVRVSIVSGRVDTIARVRAPRLITVMARNDKGQVTNVSQSLSSPYAIGEPVAACSDGWLAIVRLEPYRVDWRTPSGSFVRGAPLSFDAVRLTDSDKQAFMARAARMSGERVQGADTYPEWPANIPPVEERSRFTAICSPDRHVLVNRSRSAVHPEARYDVIDRRGSRTRQVTLSANEFIIGFGNHRVYSVFVDDDGAQHIRRYAWR